jgi:hypothetical protein
MLRNQLLNLEGELESGIDALTEMEKENKKRALKLDHFLRRVEARKVELVDEVQELADSEALMVPYQSRFRSICDGLDINPNQDCNEDFINLVLHKIQERRQQETEIKDRIFNANTAIAELEMEKL